MSDFFDSHDLIGTKYQGVISTHSPQDCAGPWCCIHNPSSHHMREWPLWFDKTRGWLAYRLCEHGVPHPDPDSLAYMVGRLGEEAALYLALHTCEGCCTEGGFIGAR